MALTKIAVNDTDGIQTDRSGKIKHYYAVDANFDFVANPTVLDATDCDSLFLFWDIRRIDYKNFRAGLMTYVAGTGFANLSNDHKKIASEHFVVAKTDRDTVHTMDEQIANGLNFHVNSIECRENRFRKAAAEVYNRLAMTDADVVIDDINTNNLDKKYKDYGKEGTDSGDPEAIYDYIKAKAGTGFASTGLAAKGFTPIGMTMQQLSDRIVDILNGEE